MIEPPVCVALDVPGLDEAGRIVSELSGVVPLFKVGLELFCADGPRTVEVVREAGAQCFLDLKVHDIPRTAAACVREVSKLGVSFLTIHGFGGREMIRASVEEAKERGGPRLLTVTVLTSLDDPDLHELGIARTSKEQALRIAQMAAEVGTDGVVLSPRELDVVRPAVPDLVLATPGVRPQGSSIDDHRRTLSPAEAILRGADLIIVGRPILDAPDRRAAAVALVEEVRTAEAEREVVDGEEVSLLATEDADYG